MSLTWIILKTPPKLSTLFWSLHIHRTVTSFIFLRHCCCHILLRIFDGFPSIPRIQSHSSSLVKTPTHILTQSIYLPTIIFYGSLSYALLSSQQFFHCLLLIIHVTDASNSCLLFPEFILSANLHASVIVPLKSIKYNLPHKTSLLIWVYLPPSESLTSSRGPMMSAFLNCIICAHSFLYSTRL